MEHDARNKLLTFQDANSRGQGERIRVRDALSDPLSNLCIEAGKKPQSCPPGWNIRSKLIRRASMVADVSVGLLVVMIRIRAAPQ